MVIIETPDEFTALCKRAEGKAVLAVPLMSDIHAHPCVNGVCLVSLVVLDGPDKLHTDNHYIIPFEHNEAINTMVDLSLLRYHTLITPDKKLWKHLADEHTVTIDINGIEYATKGSVTPEETFYTPTMRRMYSLFRKQKNINRAVPLMDLVKYFEAVHEHMKKVYWVEYTTGVTSQRHDHAAFHNDVVIPTLCTIEEAGLSVNPTLFDRFYPNKNRNIVDGKVYTEYNPYSLTGRITNTFDGINYAALPTKNDTRKMFTSRFEKGRMVSIDFTSFHPLIIADLIGYTFPEPVYQYLAKQYFGVDNPSEEEIKASKLHTMKLLYDDAQPTDVEFIQKMYEYRDGIWESIQANDCIYSPHGHKISLDAIENPNPGKLLSYVIQLREMEITMELISKVLTNIEFFQAQTKVVLYTYDSILLDYCLDDGPHLLRRIVELMEDGGKFPVKIEAGETFGNLENVTSLVKKGGFRIGVTYLYPRS